MFSGNCYFSPLARLSINTHVFQQYRFYHILAPCFSSIFTILKSFLSANIFPSKVSQPLLLRISIYDSTGQVVSPHSTWLPSWAGYQSCTGASLFTRWLKLLQGKPNIISMDLWICRLLFLNSIEQAIILIDQEEKKEKDKVSAILVSSDN